MFEEYLKEQWKKGDLKYEFSDWLKTLSASDLIDYGNKAMEEQQLEWEKKYYDLKTN